MMVAGQIRGQFEERIKTLMNEVRRTKNTILFIDELLPGRAAAPRAIDTANVLKPSSRGEIRSSAQRPRRIPQVHRKIVRSNAGLDRYVNEPSAERFPNSSRNSERYESHHHVNILDSACVRDHFRTVYYRKVSSDKAIDVIDEAGARIHLKTMTRPPDLKDIDSQMQELQQQKDSAVKQQDFESAATIRDKIEQFQERKVRILNEWRNRQEQASGTVDDHVIAEVVSKMTGVRLRGCRPKIRNA